MIFNKERIKFKSIPITNKDNNFKKSKPKIIINKYFFIIIFPILLTIYFIILKQNKKNENNLNTDNDKNKLKIYESEDKEFNEDKKQEYYNHQKFFCKNKDTFYNNLFEDKIELVNAIFDNISFDMFVYKKNDGVSNDILKYKVWEKDETTSILLSLNYYSKRKNISKKDIFILDVGANIGWYSLILGKNGFNIISFEPSKINYYILLKNYCLNKDINVTIINEGLDNELTNCTIYHPSDNIGDAIIFTNLQNININKYIKEEIKLNKLANYITYLNNKNLALIKLDIEGSELKALESGYDLISKYHIPFIFLEWSQNLLQKRGTDPKTFLEILENNGYKFSIKDFLSQQYCSINELIKIKKGNIYVVYSKFLE